MIVLIAVQRNYIDQTRTAISVDKHLTGENIKKNKGTLKST